MCGRQFKIRTLENHKGCGTQLRVRVFPGFFLWVTRPRLNCRPRRSPRLTPERRSEPWLAKSRSSRRSARAGSERLLFGGTGCGTVETVPWRSEWERKAGVLDTADKSICASLSCASCYITGLCGFSRDVSLSFLRASRIPNSCSLRAHFTDSVRYAFILLASS